MVVIDGYLDESGIHHGARVCVVAGYWGNRNSWKKFARAWQKVLDNFEVPYLHARELWATHKTKKNPYFNWTRKKEKQFVKYLADVIGRHAIYPVTSAVNVSDFFKYGEKQRRFLTGAAVKPNWKLSGTGSPNKPYFMPFFLCVDSIAGYAPRRGKAHFFCGLDRTFAKYAVDLLRQAKAHPETRHREKMGDLTLPEAAITPHLQAADMLAYLAYQYGKKRISHEGERPEKLLLKCLRRLRNPQEDNVWINKESIDGSYREVLRHLS